MRFRSKIPWSECVQLTKPNWNRTQVFSHSYKQKHHLEACVDQIQWFVRYYPLTFVLLCQLSEAKAIYQEFSSTLSVQTRVFKEYYTWFVCVRVTFHQVKVADCKLGSGGLTGKRIGGFWKYFCLDFGFIASFNGFPDPAIVADCGFIYFLDPDCGLWV